MLDARYLPLFLDNLEHSKVQEMIALYPLECRECAEGKESHVCKRETVTTDKTVNWRPLCRIMNYAATGTENARTQQKTSARNGHFKSQRVIMETCKTEFACDSETAKSLCKRLCHRVSGNDELQEVTANKMTSWRMDFTGVGRLINQDRRHL